ncbi:hypothetical protein ACHHYP_16381 [Achlya hypogyna]|uniref:CNNM transmembrane domain-containing protein n=1 Tax=Achlya hypogyna TaxID=1202772 RepID=A0A1V9Y8P4_ACHHY|nr:hypothetical protein ACHHYP_16381 [Achlya hypogyna]
MGQRLVVSSALLAAAASAHRPAFVTHVERLDATRLFYRGDVYLKVPTIETDSCENDLYLIYSCNPTKYIISVLCVIGLVMLAGAMSGLTVGVLSLNRTHLSVLQSEGEPKLKLAAQRLLPVLHNHRLLLVTLVLMNALANEALPMFLNTLINPVASVVFSVTFVVLFGEIVPTALCTGERQLLIGAACVPFLRFLMRLTYPLTYPIALFLNRTVGDTAPETPYSRNELKALVALQAHPNGLRAAEVSLIQGILELGNHTAGSVMTPVLMAPPSPTDPCVPSTSHRVQLPEGADLGPDWADHDLYVHHSTIYCVDRIFNQVTRLHKCLRAPLTTPLTELYARLQDQKALALITNEADDQAVVGIVTWHDVLRATLGPSARGCGDGMSLALDMQDDRISCSSTDSSTSPDGHVPKGFFAKDDDHKYSRLCILPEEDEDTESATFAPQSPVLCS